MSGKKLTALIDGDIYIFKAAAVAEHAVQWTEDLWTLHAHMSDAVLFLDDQIEQIRKDTGATGAFVPVRRLCNRSKQNQQLKEIKNYGQRHENI